MTKETKWYYVVSPVGIVGRDFSEFTYEFPETLAIGTIVQIPVGKRLFVGVVVGKTDKPKFATKPIERILLDKSLPPATLKLHKWISEFYAAHPGTTWQTILPAGLAKKRRALKPKNEKLLRRKRTNIVFNSQQIRAIQTLLKSKKGTSILHGITGSGKTEIYKALAMEAAARNKSSIILVPEISLTAQLVAEFQADFPHVIVTHSTMTEAERFDVWKSCLQSTEPVVVIGPRSALFMPLENLGLIVIDECHEPSFKQEQAPRYNALRAASVLADTTDSRLVLGSATPAITDYYMAKKLGRPVARLMVLAKKGAVRPEARLVDMTKRNNFLRHPFLSNQLLASIEQALASNKQVLLFHNRRGTASTTLCEDCGWLATCPRCFIPLTLHADKFILRCHLCNHKEKPPTACPDCGNTNIIHRGIGTKRIADEVTKLFPEATLARFDGDATKSEQVQEKYQEIYDGKISILIGTQTIAKGLDLPKLAVVGIIQADSGLSLPDFGASERTFQLIAQACGRVGRSSDPTTVIVQSYQPTHPAVICGMKQDYTGFYDYAITERRRGHFPPFAHLLKLTNSYKSEKTASARARKLADRIASEIDNEKTRILGPAPAFYERTRGAWRWQIVVRSSSRAELAAIAAQVHAKHWTAELDPISLL